MAAIHATMARTGIRTSRLQISACGLSLAAHGRSRARVYFPVVARLSRSSSLRVLLYSDPLPGLVRPYSRSRRGQGRRQGGDGRPTAQWKQEILWTEANVAETEEIATNLQRIVLDISSNPELKGGHTKPGQFVQMKIGESKPAFIAIASAPKVAESGALEFLIKDAPGTTAELLCDLARGGRVEVSQVLGKGFNVDLLTPAEEYPAVLLFATGSGISPVRSLLEAGIDAGKRHDVRLYYGAHDLDHMAYKDKFAAWEASGVKVIPVLSSPPLGWEGEKGYVQHAFGRSQTLSEPAKTGAVLVGQKAMAEELTAMLVEAGITKERILLNF